MRRQGTNGCDGVEYTWIQLVFRDEGGLSGFYFFLGEEGTVVVPAYPKAIAVDGPSCEVEPEFGGKSLVDDGMGGAGEEMGEQDGLVALVDEEAAHGWCDWRVAVDRVIV